MKQQELFKQFETAGNKNGTVQVQIAAAKMRAKVPAKAKEELTFVTSDGEVDFYLTSDGNFALLEAGTDLCVGAVSGAEVLRLVRELLKESF